MGMLLNLDRQIDLAREPRQAVKPVICRLI